MIDLTIDAQQVSDHIENTRRNILLGIRVGMQEAMEGLAWTVADKLGGDPIVSRSGGLLGAVLASPRVTAGADTITGSVSAYVSGKGPLGLWLEEGISVPAAAQGVLYQFTPSDGKSVFTHGHAAFQVAPHPFLNPSLEQYKPTIFQIISEKVDQASAE